MGTNQGASILRSPPPIDSPTQRVRPSDPSCTSLYLFVLMPECNHSSMHNKARLGACLPCPPEQNTLEFAVLVQDFQDAPCQSSTCYQRALSSRLDLVSRT